MNTINRLLSSESAERGKLHRASGRRRIFALAGGVLILGVICGCTSPQAYIAEPTPEPEPQAEVEALVEDARQAELARQAAEREAQALREELERAQREREAAARARELAEREAAERARQAAELRRQQQQAEQALLARQQEERLREMERQLLEADAAVQRREQANARLMEAVTATEELLQMLASEQFKYDNVDDNGQTVEPLQKALIQELEERKNTLLREAQALSD